MAVRDWHPGKLVILWAWGAVFVGLAYVRLTAMNTPSSTGGLVVGFGLIGIVFGVPLVLSVVTWKWLGGKQTTTERRER